MTRRRTADRVLIVLFFSVCGQLAAQEYDAVYGNGTRKLVVATGSPGELGLLKVLAEAFAHQCNVKLCWINSGSGKSLQLLHDRKVDAVMVHAPRAEKRAVREGWARARTLIGSNEFFLVGPLHDPANVRAAKTIADAYKRIARARAKFFSRADNSGTHKREMAIWKKAGIAPQGPWYIKTGQFMLATLKRANAERGYFMTDSSTWIAERKHLRNLKVLFRGDPLMVNVYHALCQPPKATPGAALAMRFVTFFASETAQQILRDFGRDKYGQALYNDARYAKQYE